MRHENQIKMNDNFLVGKITKIEYGSTKKANFVLILKMGYEW